MSNWQDVFQDDYQGREPGFYSLATLVAELCDRAGMPPGSYVVTLLDANVDGFIVNSERPTFTFIRALAEVFFFDPANFDGKLHFVPRGGNHVKEIDPDEVLEKVDEDDEFKRRDSLAIPRVINFSYFDLSGGLQPDMQISDRSADTRSLGELSVDTPVILRANDAQRIAIISHKTTIEEQRGEYYLEIPDNHIDLTVSDPVVYKGNRLRITEEQLDMGYQRYTLSFDRSQAYYSDAKGQEPEEPAPPEPIDPGPTRVEVLDTQPLQTADDVLGYYVAISGEQTNWRGARIEFSDDGGQNYIDSRLTYSDTLMGDLEAELLPHSRYWPDPNGKILVRIQTPYAELQSATFQEQLNRFNLAIVGDELISFGQVDEVEPGLWELSYLLRGRKGTPITTHTIGERFVLMERQQLVLIPAELYELGQDLTFRATSLGSDTQTVTSLTFVGNMQIERKVAYLAATRDGNDITVTWQGVGKFGGRTQVHHGQYFDGYRVEVDGQTVDTTDTTVNLTVSAGPHTVSVYQKNQLMGLGPVSEVDV